MRIHVLVENTSSRADLVAEHGLSLLIEACGQRILFDMGASGVFADNAARMGLSLSDVDGELDSLWQVVGFRALTHWVWRPQRLP